MSYFSHNPEAYDDIQVQGITDFFMSFWCAGGSRTEAEKKQSDIDEETTREGLISIFQEMSCDHGAKGHEHWNKLVDMAFDCIRSQEQAYWESFVR